MGDIIAARFNRRDVMKGSLAVVKGAPEFDPMNQTAEAQAMQFG